MDGMRFEFAEWMFLLLGKKVVVRVYANAKPGYHSPMILIQLTCFNISPYHLFVMYAILVPFTLHIATHHINAR
jgi:hypothetical protein